MIIMQKVWNGYTLCKYTLPHMYIRSWESKKKKCIINSFYKNLWDKIKWNKIKYKKKGERISTLKASSHFNVHVICIKNCINVNDEDSKSFMFPVPIFTVIWMYNFHLPHFTFTPWNEIKHYKGLNVRFRFFRMFVC